MIKFTVGKDMTDDDDETTSETNQVTSGWAQMWQTLGWIVFVLACFSYCCRAEIVEILK
mgnify:CR=1 FL=1|tara:strand:+ start:1580 stop:1756 length:177 start_codon:yes stop_codon:yes gene_type:complete